MTRASLHHTMSRTRIAKLWSPQRDSNARPRVRTTSDGAPAAEEVAVGRGAYHSRPAESSDSDGQVASATDVPRVVTPFDTHASAADDADDADSSRDSRQSGTRAICGISNAVAGRLGGQQDSPTITITGPPTRARTRTLEERYSPSRVDGRFRVATRGSLTDSGEDGTSEDATSSGLTSPAKTLDSSEESERDEQ